MILANGEDSILKSKRNLSVCIVATYVVLILFFSSGYKGTVAKEVADADDSISAKPGTALYYALEVEKELGPLPHFNCNDCLEIPIDLCAKRVEIDEAFDVDGNNKRAVAFDVVIAVGGSVSSQDSTDDFGE